LDPAYLQRIEAIDFTVRHDDGQNIDDLDKAEIVLVGVSRTSKTPLSIYLGYRGWKVANVPLVLGVEPPSQLFELPHRRAVGLVIKPERLLALRRRAWSILVQAPLDMLIWSISKKRCVLLMRSLSAGGTGPWLM
jgi:regulator of PEP synthase PpsR (kinase-PPPase family)